MAKPPDLPKDRSSIIDVDDYELTNDPGRYTTKAYMSDTADVQFIKIESALPQTLSEIPDDLPDPLSALGFTMDMADPTRDVDDPDASTWQQLGKYVDMHNERRATLASGATQAMTHDVVNIMDISNSPTSNGPKYFQDAVPPVIPQSTSPADTSSMNDIADAEDSAATQTGSEGLGKDFFKRRGGAKSGEPKKTQREKERQLARAFEERLAHVATSEVSSESAGQGASLGVSKDDDRPGECDSLEMDEINDQPFSWIIRSHEAKKADGKKTAIEEDIEYSRALDRRKAHLQDEKRRKRAERLEDLEDFIDMDDVDGDRAASSDEAGSDEDEHKDYDDNDELFLPNDDNGMNNPKEKWKNASERSGEWKWRRKYVKKEELQESMLFGFIAGLDAPLPKEEDLDKMEKKKRKGNGSNSKRKGNSKRRKKDKAKSFKFYSRTNLDNITSASIFDPSRSSDEDQDLSSLQRQNFTKGELLEKMIASIPDELQSYAIKDKKALEQAVNKLERRQSVQPHGDGWLIAGMSYPLRDYQLLGVCNMREMERRTDPVKGGILADSMGLGKTVTMIANMIDAKPRVNLTSKRNGLSPTLIVVPTSLVSQWQSELARHCKDDIFKKALIYRGKDVRATSDMAATLERQDIVITSYHEVMQSYPKYGLPPELTERDQWLWWVKYYKGNAGPLHQVKWLRVVCDECNSIKNYKSRTAIATSGLMARHRWLMSGTILANDIDEFYSLFRFLRIPLAKTFQSFIDNFTVDETARERLHQFLFKFMIRRTHSESLFGKPILQLPQAYRYTTVLKFSSLERKIYNIVRDRCIQDIEYRLDNGKTERISFHILVRILLLRQLASHVFCAANLLVKILQKDDIKNIKEACNDADNDEKAHKDRLVDLRRLFHEIELEWHPLPTADDEEALDSVFQKAGNTLLNDGDITGYLDRLVKTQKDVRDQNQSENSDDQQFCSACGSVPVKCQMMGPCEHHVCNRCLSDLRYDAAQQDLDKPVCPFADCRTEIDCQKKCMKHFTTDADLSRMGRKPRSETQRIRGWAETGGHMYPSAKASAVKAAIMNWKQEDKDVKIIVFTQFLSMIEVLHQVCEKEHWGHHRYTGSLSTNQRDKVLEKFRRHDGSSSILLASLMAGGVGLNLTVATKVLVVDVWWNSAQDMQAFCRVHRIGQTKKTTLHRLVVEDSIDGELLQIQARKEREIAEVLDGRPGRTGPLPIAELVQLFGISKKHLKGNKAVKK